MERTLKTSDRFSLFGPLIFSKVASIRE
uniref:Uncharacterized protein n=1 Tax=Lepeophtheirus salmonis TaxID=72036 RepID=A0A0K2TJC1_LEPSM